MKRPFGVTIIAVLTFFGAAILAIGSFAFFFVAIMDMTGEDAGQPASAALAGMGVAGGFSFLVLAGVAACLAVGVLKLREWARIVSIAAIAVGIACAIVSVFAFAGYQIIPVFPMLLAHLLVIGVAVWMLAYLVRPQVRRVFRVVAMQRLSLTHQAR